MRTLDAKLQAIHADPAGAPDFILADARDADMAFGLASPGWTRQPGGAIARGPPNREIVRQGLVDVMLMSASTNDVLAREGSSPGRL